MLRYPKYVLFYSLMFCMIVFVILQSSHQVQAEDVYGNDPLVTSKAGGSDEQNLTLSQMTADSIKSTLSNTPGKNSMDDEDKTEVEDEQDLMEKALELLEMADKYWKSGDIENTLNTLDKAYALVLDTNGNVEIARQKDDLRLLISRRILALYSSQQRRTNGKASEIPYLMNADVEKEIRSFQGPEREFFISSYQRSGLYRDLIIGELRQAG